MLFSELAPGTPQSPWCAVKNTQLGFFPCSQDDSRALRVNRGRRNANSQVCPRQPCGFHTPQALCCLGRDAAKATATRSLPAIACSPVKALMLTFRDPRLHWDFQQNHGAICHGLDFAPGTQKGSDTGGSGFYGGSRLHVWDLRSCMPWSMVRRARAGQQGDLRDRGGHGREFASEADPFHFIEDLFVRAIEEGHQTPVCGSDDSALFVGLEVRPLPEMTLAAAALKSRDRRCCTRSLFHGSHRATEFRW